MSDAPSQAQLIIRLPVGEGAATAAEALVGAVNIAAIILVVRPGGGDTPALVGSIVKAGQGAGVAMLIADDVALAGTVSADGVHLSSGPEQARAYAAARRELGPKSMIGGEVGASKHDAMVLGEAGADYVGFAALAGVDKEGASARREVVEAIEWWSEIFVIPCVAFGADTSETAIDLATAGADFVAMDMPSGLAAGACVEAARAWSTALRGTGDGEK